MGFGFSIRILNVPRLKKTDSRINLKKFRFKETMYIYYESAFSF